MLFAMLVQVQGPVVECTLQIRWLLPLKQWECPYHTGQTFYIIFLKMLNRFLCVPEICFWFLFDNSSSTPAEDPLKLVECHLAGKHLLELLKMDLKPRDIITRQSLRNAMVIVMALGGSTNAVLHLIAIAR